MTDSGIEAVSGGCKSLERLNISRLERLTDHTLRQLGSCCPHLKDVEAASCSHFTDAGFTALSNVSL